MQQGPLGADQRSAPAEQQMTQSRAKRNVARSLSALPLRVSSLHCGADDDDDDLVAHRAAHDTHGASSTLIGHTTGQDRRAAPIRQRDYRTALDSQAFS